ncbi:MAG TPA: hypothetical protein VFM18_17900 [Methanosarcina sp.]|nr:hypothetical protein [Methanosarcina sp.]
MSCPACGIELEDFEWEISAEIAAHDPNLIDVIATCPECGAKFNDFVDIREMVKL